ncbi:MAG: TolB family protein [Gemmatimonadaceae bacterium]
MSGSRAPIRVAILAAALSLLAAAPLIPSAAGAQLPARPHLDWRTLRTEHFTFHYPSELSEWTHTVAARVESVHAVVSALVGSEPSERITVLVDDPGNTANGFAVALIEAPLLYLFPTPPDPTSSIGHYGEWGELLAVHEYAHLAHLTRPSRNAWQRFLWRLLPGNLGPVARRSPRWLTEGYATYVEGQITGSGRPSSVSRPAALRQRAIEGKLPSYAELNTSKKFQGGALAYLAGSAFIEWLVRRDGEESLPHLWRRMTAREDRGFVEAFAGVYGGTPDDLYDRFTAELTAEAIAIERALRRAGLAVGDTVQQRDWFTGEPAASRDGELIAVVLGHRERASELVVWKTVEEPEDARAIAARKRALERDPQDVAAIEWRPRPKKPVATLHPDAGRAHTEPRFFADGERILVARPEPLPDGAIRPDLFIWNLRSGDVRRVTHGAGLHHADPSPTGDRAVAVQCLHGRCSVVIVDLTTGAITTIAQGTPARNYYRPRFSPDGSRIVVSVHESGKWSLLVANADAGAFEPVPGAGASSRYDASFLTGGNALVAVSERSGVANIERIDLHTGATIPISQVTGAALAPEPGVADGSILYLQLHAEGLNVARIHPDSVRVEHLLGLDSIVALDSALASGHLLLRGGLLTATAAAPPPVAPREAQRTRENPLFAVASPPLPADAPYGIGPREHRALPGGTMSPSGDSFRAALVESDPVGRLTWLLQGAYGEESSWRGGALSMAYRRHRPQIVAEVFFADQNPSAQDDGVFTPSALDVRYRGVTALVERTTYHGALRSTARMGGSFGDLDGPAFTGGDPRYLGFAEVGGTAALFVREPWSAHLSLAASGALGGTGENDWWRTTGVAELRLRHRARGIDIALEGGLTPDDVPVFERFVVGGTPAPLVDRAILTQRVEVPAVPLGVLSGRSIVTGRVSLAGGLLHPYLWVARMDGEGSWYRVIGSEARFRFPALPTFRLPGAEIVAGIGQSLDEPFRKRVRGYISIVYRP